MKQFKKIMASFLILCLVIGMIPASAITAFAAEEESLLAAELAEAKAFTDALTINNKSNDPATVVQKFGTHFTWDNEKRENSKTYLFDWSYYNGVVFEGIEYLYEVTGEDVYKEYVEEYMSSLIKADGTWATCSNNSSKQCAGYNSTHGADCYKTASLLLDMYKMTGDTRYSTIAKTLYADLDTAATKYSLSNAGDNYRHTWSSDPSPDLWLDGLYMILPFRAEYAKYTDDTEELDLIVDRMQWVSDNMYNEEKGLFYHAADSATSNSGTHWLRAIGWYAAAIVDIMDSMEGENLEAMKKQLVKLVDGMKACQNTSNGMWLNNMAAKQSSTNPYETSGTALTCYAVMKAVNEGWLDESYADMAILAFEGICKEKLDGNALKDICFKGSPGDGNSTFYDNEGKGAGPFIMFYAEMLEYVNNQKEEPETPVVPEEPETDNTVTVEGNEITVEGVTGLTGGEVHFADKALIELNNYSDFVAYDITATLTGDEATVSIPIPAEWNATEDELVGISVENGTVKEIKGTLSADGIYTFKVEHFSAKGVAYNARAAVETPKFTGEGNLVGEKVYTLDTNGVTANKDYLIVSTASSTSGYALTNNNGEPSRTSVSISGTGTNRTISVEDDKNIAWKFSDEESGTIGNNGRYVYPTRYSITLDTDDTNMTISNQGDGAYKLYRTDGYYYYYLRYNSGSWTGGRTNSTNNIVNVYLYEATYTNGAAVTFAVTPPSEVELKTNNKHSIKATVTMAGEEVDLSRCEITWSSSDSKIASVNENGVVTGEAEGTTYIHATLSAVNGTALKEDIVLVIPVTVQSKTIVEGSAILTGNTPVTTKKNVAPDFSEIKLEVTYDDNTTGIITVENGLVITDYDITEIGYTYAKISYKGVEYGTVRVTVEGNPYAGLTEATKYPEYPADGAVRIDKSASANADTFKNTGVTHVELDVAGISAKKGVNVIMISDISNSMSWDDSQYNYNDTIVTDGTNQRLNISKASAKAFAKEFLKDNTGVAATDNTFTLLAFAGIDAEYNTHSTASDNDDVYQLGALGMTKLDDAEVAIDKLVKATTGGTNYDYAFQQAYYLSEELYATNGKDVYIIFMTDGAPTHYNGVYYKSRSSQDLTARMKYADPLDPITNINDLPFYISNGTDGKGNSIDVKDNQNVTIHYNDGTTSVKNVRYNKGWSDYVINNLNGWAEKVKAQDYVSAVYSIGFGMKNGSVTQNATTSMPTLSVQGGGDYYIPSSTTQTLLKHIASTEEDYHEADNKEELEALYSSLATKIKFAGTSAEATDVIGNNFTLQMAAKSGSGENTATLNNFGITPQITVKTYDLYTKAETEDENLIGTRKGTSETLEQVTFNHSGTEAYSNLVDNGETNILVKATDGTVTITGHYFTYTKTPEGQESFKWFIGNITDKEIVLGFDVYLKGSLEGNRPENVYYTNEQATLEYIDIDGKHATQIFPRPAISWGGASTTIRFYLVNEKGQSVNRAGEVVPIANCIYVGEPVTINLNLNEDATIDAKVIEAAAYVPSDYFLYDINAAYTIQTSSGDDNSIEGGIVASEPSEDARKTAGGKTQTGAQTTITVDFEPTYYTYSTVGFGVRYDLTQEETSHPLVKDQIVIDYGKNVQVNVLSNDPEVSGYTRKLTGFVAYNANTNLAIKQLNAGSSMYTSNNGVYGIEDQNVQFKPNKMLSQVEKVFYVVKYTNTTNEEDFYYLFGQLDIIPATVMYYETDFADGVFTNVTTGGEWKKATVEDDSVADGPQDDGTIGVDQTYGYDSTYNNDSKLSNGSSLFVEGQGIKLNDSSTNYTYSKFEFTGTGFDLISRTGAAQGAIRVDIYSDKDRTSEVKSVTVLNKSETALELYQIPVVSVNDLPYDTYYVNIGVNAAYENEKYPQLNRGGEFYFDAIRIFNPAKGNAEAEAAYKADNEYNMSLIEVRDQLISAENYDVSVTNELNAEGITFVDSTYEKDNEGNLTHKTGSVGVADYKAIGPNNEVYLANGQGIAFKIDWEGGVPESIDIGAKTITGNTACMTAYISADATIPTTPVINGKNITSSTAQFHKLIYSENAVNFSEKAYVFVKNTGEGVLSITDIKVAHGSDANAANEIAVFSNARTLMFARACMAPPVEVVESAEITSVNTDKSSYTVGDTVKTTVTTNAATSYVTVNGKKVTEFTEYGDERVWTLSTKTTKATTLKFNVVAYNELDEASEEVTKTVTVKQFAPKKFKIALSKKTVVAGDKVKVTVTTSTDVKYVKINGKKVTKYANSTSSSKTWTLEVKTTEVGKTTIKAVAYNKNDSASKTITATATVKKFAPKTFNTTLSKSTVKVGEKYTVSVKTSADVKYVKVNGKKITEYTTNKDKTVKTFKVTYKEKAAGKKSIKVIAYNKNNSASNTKTKTLNVKKK